jgi:hypothetical protein
VLPAIVNARVALGVHEKFKRGAVQQVAPG